MAMLGIGTVIGALGAAHRAKPTRRSVLGSATLLGTFLLVAAALPALPAFEVALIPVGALAVFFGTNANAHMQVWSEPRLRGRVMAIYMLLTLGSTVIGGPFVGWICQHWNPRVGHRGRRPRDTHRRRRAVGAGRLVGAHASVGARARPRRGRLRTGVPHSRLTLPWRR